MVELEQMREQYLLQDRVILMGSVSPSDVHSVSSVHKMACLFVINLKAIVRCRYSIEDKYTSRRR
jgi:hypothetical protein